jgi:hypothetical protein
MEISQPEKIYTNSLRHSIKLNRFSSNIMQSFLIVFMAVAFFNSIIFGISEYRDSRKNILKDFKYLALSVNDQLSDAIWKSNHNEMKIIAETLLKNYNVSAIKIVNSDTNYVEVENVKKNRKKENSYISDIVYTYDKKIVRVGRIEIFTDDDATLNRSKKTIALLFFKTFIEALTIFVLIFWAFKKLFSDYLAEAEAIIQNKEFIPINLKYSHSLSLLEKTFKELLDSLFKLYFNYIEEHKAKEIEETKAEEKAEPEIKPELVPITASRVLQFLNPNRDYFKRLMKDMFIYSKGIREDLSDTYIFVELEKSKEFLFFMIDFGAPIGITSSDIGLILKDAEREILIKQTGNNKNLALNKILEFLDKKIRNRFAELGINSLNHAEFKGIVIHFDKILNKFEYCSKGVTIIKFQNNKLSTYDDFGAIADRSPHSTPGDGLRDYIIELDNNTNLYIISDGMFRQVKKDKNKEELGRNGVLDIMNKVTKNEFSTQQKLFSEEFDKAKGDKPLSDSITVIGLSF